MSSLKRTILIDSSVDETINRALLRQRVGPLSNSASTFIAEPRTRSDVRAGAIPVNIHVNHGEVHSIKYYASPREAASGKRIRALNRKPAAA